MRVNTYLGIVAYKDTMYLFEEPSEVWKSKFDDSYLIHVGLEKKIKFLADREITEQLTHGVGFSPKDGKWYGWSHRAIFGFSVGSTCKKGNCHYISNSLEEMIEDYVNSLSDTSKECADKYRSECSVLPDGSGILINHSGIELPMAQNLGELEDNLNWGKELETELVLAGVEIKKCGRGEWVAKTMEDAKQMAKDFNEGVS